MERTHLIDEKTYEEYLDEGRSKTNQLMDKVLMVINLTAPGLLIGKLCGLFTTISYSNIAHIFCISVLIFVTHHFIIKKISVSKNAGILVMLALDFLIIVMANGHVGIHITMFLVPMVSIIYYNKPIYFVSCFLNYISIFVITYTTADYYSSRDSKYMGNSLAWIFNRMGGYTIETLLMVILGYILLKTIIDNSKALYTSLVENKTDKMTGIHNRKAFEEDKDDILSGNMPKNLILFYIDINGLKSVNDDKGHLAGDELICGAADCIAAAMGKYGKIYRTGGDEFIALVQTTCSPYLLIAELNAKVKDWAGESNDKLQMSVGFATTAENPGASFKQLEYKAEQMMYSEKEKFYSQSGIDRRRK